MARAAKKETPLTTEEKLAKALVPEEEQPYPVPENWCWVHLLDSFENQTDSKRKIPQKEYSEQGRFAIVDQGQDVIGGYTNDENMIFTGELPVIVFGDHTRCIKYINFSFVQGADGVKILAPHKFYLPKAFFYALQSIDIPNMGYRRHYPLFKNYKLPLPPLPEQQRIVTLIESLFADLDAAKEKLQAVLDGFAKRRAALLHQAFMGELLGKKMDDTIPLEKIVEIIKIGPFGSSLHKEEYIIGGIPVINPKHIVNQHINSEEKVTITKEKANELDAYRLKAGDIVMGRRGEMGRCAAVTKNEDGWLCGTGSLIIRLKKGYDATFYSQIISSQSSIQYLEENCVGSTMKNLNEKIIKSLPIPNYTFDEQKHIVRILDDIFTKESQSKAAVESALAEIEAMKKAILATAFRGEFRTNDSSDESAGELLRKVL